MSDRKSSDLPTRVIVGLALVGLAGIALWCGGLGFWLVLVVAGLLMLAEWGALTGAATGQRRIAQYALMVAFAILAPAPLAAGAGWFALGLLLGAALFTALVTRRQSLAGGVLYVGLPVFSLLLLRAQPGNGLLLAFWTMSLVWACDSGAYFAGRAIGGPKLAPSISPGKTWAGFWGGLATATIYAWALTLIGLPLHLVVATPLLAALAQAGDLFESQLKRRAGVKDSGALLPGHGGLMDRLDGLVPVAPIAAILVVVPRWFS